MLKQTISFLLLHFFLIACNSPSNSDTNSQQNITSTDSTPSIEPPKVLSYSVVKIYPHNTSYFTEGLFLHENFLYESTGLEGESKIIKYNPENGKIANEQKVPAEYFGEGISILNNQLFHLTYTQHKVFTYNKQLQKQAAEFEWPYEGWGLTNDGKQLIISTGGNNLYMVNPQNFKIEKTIGVFDNNGYLNNINELEYVNGFVYANVWQTDYIIKIDLATGKVVAKADLSQILQKNQQVSKTPVDYLNGIAYHEAKQTFYITGKYWPAIFEIKFQ